MAINFLELFSGSGRISKRLTELAKKDGVDIVCRTVDYDPKCNPDFLADISKMSWDDMLALFPERRIDFIWASPDCKTYSIATHKHRYKKNSLEPLTPYAIFCDQCNKHLWGILDKVGGGVFLILWKTPEGFIST